MRGTFPIQSGEKRYGPTDARIIRETEAYLIFVTSLLSFLLIFLGTIFLYAGHNGEIFNSFGCFLDFY